MWHVQLLPSDFRTLSCEFGFKFYVESNKFTKVIELILKKFFVNNLSNVFVYNKNLDDNNHDSLYLPRIVPNALISHLAKFSKLILSEECLKGVSFQDLINWTVSKIRNHHLQKQSARKKGENVAGIETDKNTAPAQPSKIVQITPSLKKELKITLSLLMLNTKKMT